MTASSRVRSYRVQEFAKLAGVTVRTLHHYDRIGLLKPRRTRASYRVYLDSDLPRLHQILVLKFLGVSLADIAEVLKRPARLEELLKTRQYAVKRKRARLNIEQHMLDQLRDVTADERNWADLASFAGELAIHSEKDGWRKPRLDEALRLLTERRIALDVTLEEYELNRDVRAAIARGDTPDTPGGQAIVARWRDAIDRFVNGDRKLRDALVLVMDAQAGQPDAAYRAYLDRALHQAS
jgi:DNA-binding transcriptional MerR regulator